MAVTALTDQIAEVLRAHKWEALRCCRDATDHDVHVAERIAEALRPDMDQLLAIAKLYVDAFSEDELMTLPERMRLQQIEDILLREAVEEKP
jgi:hypothetical protein